MEDEDFKDLYVGALDDATVKWYSSHYRHLRFKTEIEAREKIFGDREHADKQSWSEIFGKDGPDRNRMIADMMPLYKDQHGYFRVGKPLGTWVKDKRKLAYIERRRQEDAEEKRREAEFHRTYPGWHYYPKIRRRKVQEYLSNMTSDFSVGTNGEPTAMPPSSGDLGTVTGLPDYKYFDRKVQRGSRLRALLQRRDPEGISKNPVDVQLRRLVGESEEGEEEDLTKELSKPGYVLMPQPTHPDFSTEHYEVEEEPGRRWLGSIWKPTVSDEKGTPTLRRIWREFSWLAQSPGQMGEASRHRTKEEAIAHLQSKAAGEKRENHGPEYWQRFDQIAREEQARGTVESFRQNGGDVTAIAESLLEAEDSDEFKQLYNELVPIGYVCRVVKGVSVGKYYGWNTERNSTWTPYLGDAKIFRRKQTWLKNFSEMIGRGYWEVVPIYSDPRKTGQYALTGEDPPKYNFKRLPNREDDPFGGD